ncbi:hypothetical protein NDN08_002475 [Rhodosorus marinus]|uniref:Coenzyme Q-binding protein COQ10 START domain-containing protein n=1 Tax=Rhodosorus marinus TaxID=101924 RepID=A0AAV8UTW0_9RHOD|nr:hypothetical protein NDN08_002475 [Rhodosorus marinus]
MQTLVLEKTDVLRSRDDTRSLISSAKVPGAAVCHHSQLDREGLGVEIQRTGGNSRRIISSIDIQRPSSLVWKVLTDYNRLADFIPNLAVSRLRPHPSGGIRLEQSGVQSVMGFAFNASVVLDMTEVNSDQLDKELRFDLHQSRELKEFRGTWFLQSINNNKDTRLWYEVNIAPKGLVPTRLVEWRIKEDVPANLKSVKRRIEKVMEGDIYYEPPMSPGRQLPLSSLPLVQ